VSRRLQQEGEGADIITIAPAPTDVAAIVKE
jgi:hypothetical protein